MKDILYSLFHDLQQRCQTLRTLLEQHQCHLDVLEYRTDTLESIAQSEDEVKAILEDPHLREDYLLANYLQIYRLCAQPLKMIEWYLVPVILHYSSSDHYLFAFLNRAITEIGCSFPTPVVSTLNNQYYMSSSEFNLILAPVLEAHSLLGLPDLFHELGHILVYQQQDEILGDFDTNVKSHFSTEIQNTQRPPEYEEIMRQWRGKWTEEFTCDMIACYLVGPSYGWTNLRLCANRRIASDNLFWSGVDTMISSTHPSDDARVKGIIEILNLMGSETDAIQIKQRWDDYVSLTGHNPPPNYDLYYPTSLLNKLAQRVLVGCREIGLKEFHKQGPILGNMSIPNLLDNAWQEFFARPHEYSAWEQRQLAELRTFLGC